MPREGTVDLLALVNQLNQQHRQQDTENIKQQELDVEAVKTEASEPLEKFENLKLTDNGQDTCSICIE